MSRKLARLKYISLAIVFAASFLVPSLIDQPSLSALSGSEFNAGKIIDDAVFFNPNSLNQSQIQTFLNAKRPTCDTNGDITIYDADYGDTVTRKVYSERRGVSTPFTCLKDYVQTTTNKTAEAGLCNGHVAGTKNAAQIIYEVAQSCGVNPKVLLVLLQKEQSLVTDDWPWPIQYRSATGYGCPDTAPCDQEYYGFFNQVYAAARVYKYYAKYPHSFNYVANRDNYIQYNPNTDCGGSNVFIQNQATAGLYVYTPYQPNAAALNNLYETGDDCSAYGNRNFWRMFSDWFGSTQMEVPYAWALESQEMYIDSARNDRFTSGITVTAGSKIYMKIRARNIGNETWTPEFLHLGTSRSNDRSSVFKDETWKNNARPTSLLEASVGPGQSGTFLFELTAPSTTGSYKEYFNLVADGYTWLNDIGLYYDINVTTTAQPITSINPLLVSGASLANNQYILSRAAQSRLVLQPDGNLVLLGNLTKKVWSSNTHSSLAKSLVMQPDGNLVLYRQDKTPVWHTSTYDNPGAYLALQTDGNLVIYSSTHEPLWSSNTRHVPDHLSFVNTTINTGNIHPHQSIETITRKHKLVLQPDGNLVLYSGSKPIWASGTNGRNTEYLSVQPDGNLVLYDKANYPVWHTNTAFKKSVRLVIQPDGNLVLYDSTNKALWSSNTSGR